MHDTVPIRSAFAEARPLPKRVALVLPGGGALGAYQAGAYEALARANIPINSIAGVSIGAVNGAIIAGNPPQERVSKLRRFWEKLSSELASVPVPDVGTLREAAHVASAAYAATFGVAGFFRPWTALGPAPAGDQEASWYDTAPLKQTLDELIDWDLLNSRHVHFSVGAVNVESGELRYFDTATDRIDGRHIMASGALPPGLPPVKIDGQWWWDGALVSNTPLMHVLTDEQEDMLVIEVDLFSPTGEPPKSVSEALAREKEIRFSSQTSDVAERLRESEDKRRLVRRAFSKLPPNLRKDADFAELRRLATDHKVSIVQLIYRRNDWESWARDFEFSRQSVEAYWRSGREAMERKMQRRRLAARDLVTGEFAAFDLTPKKD
ncbi:MAG: patatin-like phospholipase family protein [Sphingomicrobium sp.]